MKGSLVLVGRSWHWEIHPFTTSLPDFRGEKVRRSSIFPEESARQIKLRADRMGRFEAIDFLSCVKQVGTIEKLSNKRKPHIAVDSSIQTMYSEEMDPLREVCPRCGRQPIPDHLAKGMGITIFIVGHVTKEGGRWQAQGYWNT